MQKSKKITTCAIVFVLLVSSFSICIIIPNLAKAQDEEIEEFWNEIKLLREMYIETYGEALAPNPFRYVGVWVYKGNDTYLKDSITFNLYFSSTLSTQIDLMGKFRDSINVSVLYLGEDGKGKVIKNASKEVTLEPELFGGRIQGITVKLDKINHLLKKNDTIFFVIDIDQSEKLLSKYVEKQYEKRLKPLVTKIAEKLNESEDPELNEIGLTINEMMDILDEMNVTGDQIGDLANIFASSAFYYGSSNYPSEIKLSTSDANYTLYFQNEPSEFSEDEFAFFKVVNETKPTGDIDYSWPPIVNLAASAESEEWMDWLILWLIYNLGEVPEVQKNKVVYYLHEKGAMDESKPTKSDSTTSKLSESSLKWTGPKFSRNKIIKNITVDLYLYYPKLLALKTPTINVSIYDEDKLIAQKDEEISKNTLIEILKRGPDTPTTISFELNEEIFYNHSLRLEVSLVKKPSLSLRNVKLMYDSEKHPSSLNFIFEETKNIKIKGVRDKEIYAGGSAEYKLVIDSVYRDDVEINIEKENKTGKSDWTIEYYPKNISIEKNGSAEIYVFVNSTARDASAYGDYITLLFNASGKTGFTSEKAKVTVSENAVEYDIEVITPEDLKVRHGQNKTFSFIVRNRNKGYMRDSYGIVVTSDSNFSIEYDTYIKNLDVYNDTSKEPEGIVNITVSIPKYTDIKSDTLRINISSAHSGAKKYYVLVNATIEIEGPNVLESIYHFFEIAAKEIGLEGIVGEYGAWLLIFIIVFIIVIILTILLATVGRKKLVELDCANKAKEIDPEDTAEYDIIVRNFSKKKMEYEISVEKDESLGERWEISIDKNKLELEPRKSDMIKLSVKPTDYVRKDDRAEVKVIVKPVGINRYAELITVTTLKNQKLDLKISGVVHWPSYFKKGDKVETSFKLSNKGNVCAENLKVILYVNGEEKNRVENLTIPRGGFAEIDIPWIADKKRNEINIVVK